MKMHSNHGRYYDRIPRTRFEAWCDQHPRFCVTFAIVLIGLFPALAFLIFHLRFPR